MPYGLSEETIAKICDVLSRHAKVDKAVLYGSRAKGNHRPGSDIDLTLYGAHLTTSELGSIAEELDDLFLPYKIDLSLFARLNHDELEDHIERVGVLLYQRSSS